MTWNTDEVITALIVFAFLSAGVAGWIDGRNG